MAKKNLIKKQPFSGKTSIVCGASKGIGKATAKEIVMLGGSVSIVARGIEALEAAKSEVEALRVSDSQFIETISCDATDMVALKPFFNGFIETHGVPDYLLNLVGYAYPQYIQKLTLEDFKNDMEVNYFGQLVPTLIMLPHFMEVKRGHIGFVSSLGGVICIIGYASYAPSKSALVGLAETLRHELKPYNINISLLYPPDTDTPGFEFENKSKPPETAKISETANLYSSEKVAEVFIEGLVKEKFSILFGEAKLFWKLFRHAPRFVHAYLDFDYKQARKKLGKI